MSNNLIKEIQSEVEKLIINNDSQLENANELAKKCSDETKRIKAVYEPLKEDANKVHKGYTVAEKEEIEPFNKFKSKIADAILVYQKEQEKVRLMQLIESEQEEQEYGFALTEVKEALKLGGTHIRKTWKAEIIDESLIPIYHNKMVIRPADQKALNQIALYEKETAEVPGVRFYQDEKVIIK